MAGGELELLGLSDLTRPLGRALLPDSWQSFGRALLSKPPSAEDETKSRDKAAEGSPSGWKHKKE